MRTISMAAGMLLDVDPIAAVGVVAGAGFDAMGVRFLPPGPDDTTVRRLRERLDDAGVSLLDIEYARLTRDDRYGQWHRRLLEIGSALEARHVIVVSLDPDGERAAEHFAALCDLARSLGSVRPALEFMRFTTVRSLADAIAVVQRAGRLDAGVLVDALHLARGGEHPSALAGVDPALLHYLQMCDAPATPPGSTDESLSHEARRARLLPGDGELPLAELLAAAPPDVPLSVETLSDELMQRLPPPDRAAASLRAMRRVLCTRV